MKSRQQLEHCLRKVQELQNYKTNGTKNTKSQKIKILSRTEKPKKKNNNKNMKLGKANQKSKGKERTFETQTTIELQGPHGDKKKKKSQHRI